MTIYRVRRSAMIESNLRFVLFLFTGLIGTTVRSAPSFAPVCAKIENHGLRGLCQLLQELQGATPANITPSANGNKNSKYKKEGGPDLHLYATEQSTEMEQVLQYYSEMHAACTTIERNRLSTSATNLQCKYLVWSCTYGLGNQLLSLLSSFLFAILTQRVLLLDNPGWGQLFSEPFANSTWMAPPGFSFKDREPPTFTEYRALRCDATSRKLRDQRCNGLNGVSVVFAMKTAMDDQRLLVCPSALAGLKDLTFLNFRNSNQHFAAGFFLNPALRPMLEILFPLHNVFHCLSQFLLIPSDEVWGRIRHVHENNLVNASKKIGVQLREFKGEYRKYFDDVVPLCVKSKSNLCPIEMEEDTRNDKENTTQAVAADFITIYVSSLVGAHFTKLKESVQQLELDTRLRYVLLAQDSDGEQLDDVTHQQKALVDIWLLSLSDVLLTSHMSTFGYTAHALAGVTPFHLKPWLDNPCWLSVSSDPCYHFPPKRVVCKEDHITIPHPNEDVPYLKTCPDLPDTGMQLAEEP